MKGFTETFKQVPNKQVITGTWCILLQLFFLAEIWCCTINNNFCKKKLGPVVLVIHGRTNHCPPGQIMVNLDFPVTSIFILCQSVFVFSILCKSNVSDLFSYFSFVLHVNSFLCCFSLKNYGTNHWLYESKGNCKSRDITNKNMQKDLLTRPQVFYIFNGYIPWLTITVLLIFVFYS